MKKTVLMVIAITFLAAAPAMAQNMGGKDMMQAGMMDRQQQTQTGMQDNMMMGKGQGMMPMMSGGYGQMPCMMDNANMQGMMTMMHGSPGMMGSGYNKMGHYGMMGGSGMMGGMGMMQARNPDDLKKYENFIKETRDMRKKLHDLMFTYGEARWNPATTLGDLRKMTEEMKQLQDAIQKKMPK